VTAAKEYAWKACGVDIDPERVKDSLANVRKHGVERLVTIERCDIFTLDLSRGPTIVTLYLLPRLKARLLPQLRKLPPGARVISVAHRMAHVKPDEQNVVDTELGEFDVYLWKAETLLDNRLSMFEVCPHTQPNPTTSQLMEDRVSVDRATRRYATFGPGQHSPSAPMVPNAANPEPFGVDTGSSVESLDRIRSVGASARSEHPATTEEPMADRWGCCAQRGDGCGSSAARALVSRCRPTSCGPGAFRSNRLRSHCDRDRSWLDSAVWWAMTRGRLR
jgi:hypothetical protein